MYYVLSCAQQLTVPSDISVYNVYQFFIFLYFDIYVFHLPVFRLNFVLVLRVGALDDRGETDVRAARDPGIPIKFTPFTAHCAALQRDTLHSAYCTEMYPPHCTGFEV